MQTIRSVGVMSVAKLMGLMHACLSLVFVPFFLVIAAVGSFAGPQNNPMGALGAAGMTVLAILNAGVLWSIWLYGWRDRRAALQSFRQVDRRNSN